MWIIRMESQQETNDSQAIKNEEHTFFKWIVGILIGIILTFIGVFYTSLTLKDTNADTRITTLEESTKSQNTQNALILQNMQSNIYLLCKSQNADCIPPLK